MHQKNIHIFVQIWAHNPEREHMKILPLLPAHWKI